LEPEAREAGEVLARFRACRFCHAFSRFFNSERGVESIFRTTVSKRSNSDCAGFVVSSLIFIFDFSGSNVVALFRQFANVSTLVAVVCLPS
jgi:hypothetical protein